MDSWQIWRQAVLRVAAATEELMEARVIKLFFYEVGFILDEQLGKVRFICPSEYTYNAFAPYVTRCFCEVRHLLQQSDLGFALESVSAKELELLYKSQLLLDRAFLNTISMDIPLSETYGAPLYAKSKCILLGSSASNHTHTTEASFQAIGSSVHPFVGIKGIKATDKTDNDQSQAQANDAHEDLSDCKQSNVATACANSQGNVPSNLDRTIQDQNCCAHSLTSHTDDQCYSRADDHTYNVIPQASVGNDVDYPQPSHSTDVTAGTEAQIPQSSHSTDVTAGTEAQIPQSSHSTDVTVGTEALISEQSHSTNEVVGSALSANTLFNNHDLPTAPVAINEQQEQDDLAGVKHAAMSSTTTDIAIEQMQDHNTGLFADGDLSLQYFGDYNEYLDQAMPTDDGVELSEQDMLFPEVELVEHQGYTGLDDDLVDSHDRDEIDFDHVYCDEFDPVHDSLAPEDLAAYQSYADVSYEDPDSSYLNQDDETQDQDVKSLNLASDQDQPYSQTQETQAQSQDVQEESPAQYNPYSTMKQAKAAPIMPACDNSPAFVSEESLENAEPLSAPAPAVHLYYAPNVAVPDFAQQIRYGLPKQDPVQTQAAAPAYKMAAAQTEQLVCPVPSQQMALAQTEQIVCAEPQQMVSGQGLMMHTPVDESDLYEADPRDKMRPLTAQDLYAAQYDNSVDLYAQSQSYGNQPYHGTAQFTDFDRFMAQSTHNHGQFPRAASEILPEIDLPSVGKRSQGLVNAPKDEPIICPSVPTNPAYTFSTFVSDNKNANVLKSAYAICQKPGDSAHNPLYIYGASGAGKTHLLHAIINEMRTMGMDESQIAYIRTKDFIRHYVSTISDMQKTRFNNQQVYFHKSFLDKRVLVFDDLQEFKSAIKTRDVFYGVISAFLDRPGSQLILCANVPPAQLQSYGFDDRLISRLHSGLCLEVKAPSKLCCRVMLERKCLQYQIVLQENVQDYIVSKVSPDGREIDGVLKTLLSLQSNSGDISMEDAVRCMSRFSCNDKQSLTMKDVMEIAAQELNVTVKDIMSARKKKPVSMARSLAMTVIRELFEGKYSLNDIGRAFNKDHSSVHEAVVRTKKRIQSDALLHEKYCNIMQAAKKQLS